MQFSRQSTNATSMRRFQEVRLLWPKLRKCLSPYRIKVQALRVAAWPRALHGGSVVHLAWNSFKKLRSGAMKGLGENKPGASPLIHIGLLEAPGTDPGFAAIWEAVRDFRSEGEFHRAEIALGFSLVSDAAQAVNSGCFAPGSKALGAIVQHRRHFEGLGTVDVPESLRLMKSRSESQQSLMRVVHNGTFYTNDALQHVAADLGPQCTWCGQQDNLMHRLWECPHFASARTDCPADVLDLVDSLPPCLVCHGWTQEPRGRTEFLQYLLAVPDTSAVLEPVCPLGPVCDVFTDGACLSPAKSATRLALWAARLARDCSDSPGSAAIGGGWVPGVLQTACRGEIFAVLCALNYAVAWSCRCASGATTKESSPRLMTLS